MGEWITIDEARAIYNKGDSTIRRYLRNCSEKDSVSRVRRDGKIELSAKWLNSEFGTPESDNEGPGQTSRDHSATEQMHLAVESQKMNLLTAELEHSRKSRTQALAITWKVTLLIILGSLASMGVLAYLWKQSLNNQEQSMNTLKQSTSEAIRAAYEQSENSQKRVSKLESENLNLKLQLERKELKLQNIQHRRYLVTADSQPITN